MSERADIEAGREPSPGGADPLERPTADGAGGLLADLGARGIGAALRPLAGLAGMAEDIREMTAHVVRMASNTDALPEVTETLRAIRRHTENMDREVAEMHAAVEEMRLMLEPVAGQLESVSRLTDRLPGGRRRRRAAPETAEAATEDELGAADAAARAHDAE